MFYPGWGTQIQQATQQKKKQKKLQNTRSVYQNQLYFYVLVVNKLKIELRKQFHVQQHMKEKNKFKEIQDLHTENYNNGLKKRFKEAKRYFVFTYQST